MSSSWQALLMLTSWFDGAASMSMVCFFMSLFPEEGGGGRHGDFSCYAISPDVAHQIGMRLMVRVDPAIFRDRSVHFMN